MPKFKDEYVLGSGIPQSYHPYDAEDAPTKCVVLVNIRGVIMELKWPNVIEKYYSLIEQRKTSPKYELILRRVK